MVEVKNYTSIISTSWAWSLLSLKSDHNKTPTFFRSVIGSYWIWTNHRTQKNEKKWVPYCDPTLASCLEYSGILPLSLLFLRGNCFSMLEELLKRSLFLSSPPCPLIWLSVWSSVDLSTVYSFAYPSGCLPNCLSVQFVVVCPSPFHFPLSYLMTRISLDFSIMFLDQFT